MTSRWLPASEQDLEHAVADGRAEESHALEFKGELGTSKGANRELARDLAQFAVDGGTLIIGVAEPEPGRYELSPVELQGLAERIDQVARSVVDPPLPVRIDVLDAAQPGHGYVFVHVPASPNAPHAVDGRFYGRGDRTKHVLARAEVEGIIRARLVEQQSVNELLEVWIARDPIPAEVRKGAHLFLIAHPTTAREGMLFDALRVSDHGNDPYEVSQLLLRDRPSRQWSSEDRFAPDIAEYTSNRERRPEGWAFFSSSFNNGRQFRTESSRAEEGALDLEITEDGTLRMFCGRAAMAGRDGEPYMIFEVLILGLVKRALFIVANIAEVAGYLGPWDVAVGITGLEGKVSSHVAGRWLTDGVPYQADEHRGGTRVTIEQLQIEDDIDVVVERLVGRLNRALNGGTVLAPRIRQAGEVRP